MKLGRFFVYLIMIFLLSATVLAGRADTEDSDSFALSQPHTGNLYLDDSDITISSDLYGDLYATSQKMMISALVRDDVVAAVKSFYLKGTIGSDLRLAAMNAKLDGTVFGETLICARDVVFTNYSLNIGVVRVKAKNVVLDGTIKNDLYVTADKVTLNGVVEGNARIEAAIFEMGPNAKVTGDLSSNRMIQKDDRIGGSVIKLRDKYSPENAMSITFGKIIFFLMIMMIGAAVILVSRKYSERTAKAMYGRFWLSLLMGVIVLIIAPIAGFLLLFTFIGIPITILLALAYIGVLIVSVAFSAMLLGRLDLKMFSSKRKNALWLELTIGAIIIALLSFIPVVFWIILAFLMITAVGGMFLAAVRKEERKKAPRTAAKGRR